ncbi:hypothetical protein AVEN_162596-2-1, partial [Araneus ventricosus]
FNVLQVQIHTGSPMELGLEPMIPKPIPYTHRPLQCKKKSTEFYSFYTSSSDVSTRYASHVASVNSHSNCT